jgi:hypothetical protein
MTQKESNKLEGHKLEGHKLEGTPPALTQPIDPKEVSRLKERAQGQLKRLGEFSRFTQKDLKLAIAARDEQVYRADLEHCRQQLKKGAMGRDEALNRIQIALEQIAEALLIQGDVYGARAFATESQNPLLLDRVTRILEAITRPDDEFCQCPDQLVDGVAYPVHYTTEEFLSPVHKEWTPIIVCSACGTSNITPAKPVAKLYNPKEVELREDPKKIRPDKSIFK